MPDCSTAHLNNSVHSRDLLECSRYGVYRCIYRSTVSWYTVNTILTSSVLPTNCKLVTPLCAEANALLKSCLLCHRCACSSACPRPVLTFCTRGNLASSGYWAPWLLFNLNTEHFSQVSEGCMLIKLELLKIKQVLKYLIVQKKLEQFSVHKKPFIHALIAQIWMNWLLPSTPQ